MKLCFGFLTDGSLNNEMIWCKYLEGIENKEIVIHCTNLPRFRCINTLTNNFYINAVPSKWGSLQRVENFLLEKCRSLNCDKLILLSNSCLPVRNIDYLVTKLDNRNSYISYGKSSKVNRFPENNFNIEYFGSPQWCIIDKSHYDIFLNDETRDYFEDQVICPEESYFATLVKKHKLEDSVINSETTYVDWGRSDGNSPYTFQGTEHDLTDIDSAILKEDIFFIRKVKDNTDEVFLHKILELLGLERI